MIITIAQVGIALHLLLALGVSGHILLTKTDVRAAIGWTGLVWLTPVVGSVFYLFLGINRIRRRAGRLRPSGGTYTAAHRTRRDPAVMDASIDPVSARMRPLATLVGAVSGAVLTHGNTVDPLMNGDEAYPAMIAAIDAAQWTVALVTYIFDRGTVADMFLDALERAVKRGVTCRVLVDYLGGRRWLRSLGKHMVAGGIQLHRILKVGLLRRRSARAESTR